MEKNLAEKDECQGWWAVFCTVSAKLPVTVIFWPPFFLLTFSKHKSYYSVYSPPPLRSKLCVSKSFSCFTHNWRTVLDLCQGLSKYATEECPPPCQIVTQILYLTQSWHWDWRLSYIFLISLILNIQVILEFSSLDNLHRVLVLFRVRIERPSLSLATHLGYLLPWRICPACLQGNHPVVNHPVVLPFKMSYKMLLFWKMRHKRKPLFPFQAVELS